MEAAPHPSSWMHPLCQVEYIIKMSKLSSPSTPPAQAQLHIWGCAKWPVYMTSEDMLNQADQSAHNKDTMYFQILQNWNGKRMIECRAIMVQLGFFSHMKLALGAPSLTLTRPLSFAISFMLLFSIVIALFKDIPDVKGDAQVGPASPCSVLMQR